MMHPPRFSGDEDDDFQDNMAIDVYKDIVGEYDREYKNCIKGEMVEDPRVKRQASASEDAQAAKRELVEQGAGANTPVKNEPGTCTPVKSEPGTGAPVKREANSDTLPRPKRPRTLGRLDSSESARSDDHARVSGGKPRGAKASASSKASPAKAGRNKKTRKP